MISGNLQEFLFLSPGSSVRFVFVFLLDMARRLCGFTDESFALVFVSYRYVCDVALLVNLYVLLIFIMLFAYLVGLVCFGLVWFCWVCYAFVCFALVLFVSLSSKINQMALGPQRPRLTESFSAPCRAFAFRCVCGCV